jgi:hypothetical protein
VLLIDDLFMLPASVLMALADQVCKMSESELFGPENIKNELLRLQLKLETDEITESEYNEAESILLERLDVSTRQSRPDAEDEETQ